MGDTLDTPDFKARLHQVAAIDGRSRDVMTENSGSKSIINTKTKAVNAIGQALVSTAAAAAAAGWLAGWL